MVMKLPEIQPSYPERILPEQVRKKPHVMGVHSIEYRPLERKFVINKEHEIEVPSGSVGIRINTSISAVETRATSEGRLERLFITLKPPVFKFPAKPKSKVYCYLERKPSEEPEKWERWVRAKGVPRDLELADSYLICEVSKE
ncbi:MAG: hypothetical protein JRD89_04735 [Deltaproteobacteria bacterium]|nr:hypothetical protein [Deltaproteobacteria bacterium]